MGHMMKYLSMALVILVITSSHIPPTEAVIDTALYGQLLSKLLGLFPSGAMDFMGHECYFRVRPRVKRWKWRYEGKVWCPGWTSITGRSLRSGRSSATNDAVRDFLNKAVAANIINENQARQWV